MALEEDMDRQAGRQAGRQADRQTARSLWIIFMTGFSVKHALIRLASPIKIINYRQSA